MVDCRCLVDSRSSGSHCLVRVALHPENAREVDQRGHPLIEAEADRLQSRSGRGGPREHGFDLRPRLAGIAETEQRDADDPVTQQQI